MSLSSITKTYHTVVLGSTGSFALNQAGGFNNTDRALQLYFTGTRVLSRLGANPPVQLGDVFINANSLLAVFDQFRIMKAQVDIYFTNNSSGINNTLQLPIIFGVVDKDDAGPLSSSANALAYSTCKTLQMGNSSGDTNGRQTMYVNRPCIVQASAQTAAVTPVILGSCNTPSPWIDNAYEAVEHFGLKFWVDNTNVTTAAIGNVTFVTRLFVQYRNLK